MKGCARDQNVSSATLVVDNAISGRRVLYAHRLQATIMGEDNGSGQGGLLFAGRDRREKAERSQRKRCPNLVSCREKRDELWMIANREIDISF